MKKGSGHQASVTTTLVYNVDWDSKSEPESKTGRSANCGNGNATRICCLSIPEFDGKIIKKICGNPQKDRKVVYHYVSLEGFHFSIFLVVTTQTIHETPPVSVGKATVSPRCCHQPNKSTFRLLKQLT